VFALPLLQIWLSIPTDQYYQTWCGQLDLRHCDKEVSCVVAEDSSEWFLVLKDVMPLVLECVLVESGEISAAVLYHD
jgi:hypothetical protein